MSWKTKYSIEFKGLKEGLHDFEYEIDDTFFAHFEDSLVDKGNILAKVILEKRSAFMKVHMDFEGWLGLTCDRCLEPYKQPVENSTEMFVKFGDENDDDGENVIWVNPEEHQVNLVQMIYEYIALSIPMRHVHPKNSEGKRECDPDMIERLKKYKHTVSEKEHQPDSRWDALRKLTNNN